MVNTLSKNIWKLKKNYFDITLTFIHETPWLFKFFKTENGSRRSDKKVAQDKLKYLEDEKC